MEPSPFFGLSPCCALALRELKTLISRGRRILNFTSDILLSGGPGFTYRITA
ncbi:hypothetical protein K443DRAFT_687282, partial [Laccaria amethystina LaAM-08-1]